MPPDAPISSRFTHVNEAFDCLRCGKTVPPRRGGCRNHCPFCLMSRHVDVLPGDRANPCAGPMPAVDYDLDGKKGLVLVFKCERCGETTRCVSAREDQAVPDDYDAILALKAGMRPPP